MKQVVPSRQARTKACGRRSGRCFAHLSARAGVVGRAVEVLPPAGEVVRPVEGGEQGKVRPLVEVAHDPRGPSEVPAAGVVEVGGHRHLGDPVLADRLERPVARAATGGPGHQQAVLGQAGQAVGDRGGFDGGEAGDGGRLVRGERRGEHGDPAQQRLVDGRQEVVAPVDGGAQRAVPLVDPRSAGEEAKALGQAALDAVEAQRR